MKQLKWLNCAKFIAILTVMIDHTYMTLYDSKPILYASFVSVSLFILISGMTSYLSNSHHEENWFQTFFRGSKKLIAAYCIATLVHQLHFDHRFDLVSYLTHLIHFNISRTHYFVLLYLQLMLTSRFLYMLLQKCPTGKRGMLYEALILIAVTLFSAWCSNYTNILGVYGGAGKLFAGTYLVSYFVGMLIMKHSLLEKASTGKCLVLTAAGGAVWFAIWRHMCQTGYDLAHYTPAELGLNPPGLLLTIQTVAVLVLLFGLFTLMDQLRILIPITNLFAFIGKHTLYIFLYHDMIYADYLVPYLYTDNVWINRIIFLFGMIAIPLALEWLITQIQKALHTVMYCPKKS
ncbi:MAG: acyltransferase [Clostridia bacterium]|nr:acyltransferase [Clostridia bacterium]